MAGLPKKYARMGFKRGWAAFKRFKGSNKKTRVKRTMARKKTVRRKSKSGMQGDMATIFGSLIYGAGREWASNKLDPITQKIPAGEVTDEVGMLALSYLLKKGKIPFIKQLAVSKDIGKAGMAIEAARIGEFILNRGLPKMNTQTASQESGLLF